MDFDVFRQGIQCSDPFTYSKTATNLEQKLDFELPPKTPHSLRWVVSFRDLLCLADRICHGDVSWHCNNHAFYINIHILFFQKPVFHVSIRIVPMSMDPCGIKTRTSVRPAHVTRASCSALETSARWFHRVAHGLAFLKTNAALFVEVNQKNIECIMTYNRNETLLGRGIRVIKRDINKKQSLMETLVVLSSMCFICVLHLLKNYIFILDLTRSFNILHKDKCKMRWKKHFSFGIWCGLY